MSEPSDRISQAVKLLAGELSERLRHHPLGHLAGVGDRLELRLLVPVLGRKDALERLGRQAAEDLERAIGALLVHRRVFVPGHVYCLRCRQADCEHSAPRRPTEVYAGYGPSGLPRFAELAQWLIERRDPHVDQLYGEPPQVVTHLASGAELTADLLPAFRDQESGHRLHGQVVAGFYHARDAAGMRQPIAVSFLLLSSRSGRKPRRYGLNLLGVGPGGEPLELLYDRLGEIPWSAAAAWAEEALRGLERSAARLRDADDDALEPRLEGILAGLARRLLKDRRARGRRTQHAQQRHGERDRPTWKALDDLRQAREGDFLRDTRRDTVIVLGERGRAHVFSPQGKLVTSVRYSPASIEKKQALGLWRQASPEEVERLRKQTEQAT